MCVFLFFFTLYKLYEEVAGNRAIQSGWHTTCWAMKGHLRQHPAYIYVYIYIYMHLLYKDTAETNRSLLTWIQGSFSKE